MGVQVPLQWSECYNNTRSYGVARSHRWQHSFGCRYSASPWGTPHGVLHRCIVMPSNRTLSVWENCVYWVGKTSNGAHSAGEPFSVAKTHNREQESTSQRKEQGSGRSVASQSTAMCARPILKRCRQSHIGIAALSAGTDLILSFPTGVGSCTRLQYVTASRSTKESEFRVRSDSKCRGHALVLGALAQRGRYQKALDVLGAV